MGFGAFPLTLTRYVLARATLTLTLTLTLALTLALTLTLTLALALTLSLTLTLALALALSRYVLPRREHAGYVEEELQQLLMMLRQVPSLPIPS